MLKCFWTSAPAELTYKFGTVHLSVRNAWSQNWLSSILFWFFCIKLLDNPKITEMARAEILGCAWSEMGVASLVTWPKIDCILRLSWWDELIFACWCIFRKAKSNFNDFWVGMVKIGRGHLVHETLKSAEWVYELSWSFTCFLWCHNFW